MSKLPPRLQPLWPIFKRGHRTLSLLLGFVHRRLAPLLGSRGGPRGATNASSETAALEPGAARVHVGGPAEHLVRPMPPGSPPNHPIFAQALDVDVPERYVLALSDGITVGDYGANITSKGTLDYQTSGYFGLSSWREHPVFLRTRIPAPERIQGTVLNLNTRGCSSNYYHFMFDALPRYGILREALPDVDVDAVIVPHGTRYQRELLELAGIPGPYLQPAHDKAYVADRLLVPSTPNQNLPAPEWGTRWLREHLRASGPSSLRSRLYITRGDQPHTRRYLQEAELWPHLEQRGFSMVDPGSLSVQEQINAFSAAEVVVAPHGAGLTNIVFCPPGARILELFAGDYVHLGLWSIAQSVGGFDYRYLAGEGDPARPMVGVLTDVDIPWTRVLQQVDEMLG